MLKRTYKTTLRVIRRLGVCFFGIAINAWLERLSGSAADWFVNSIVNPLVNAIAKLIFNSAVDSLVN